MRLEVDLSSGIGPVTPPINNSAKGSGSGMGGTGGTGAPAGVAAGGTSGGASGTGTGTTGSGTGSDTGAVTEANTTDIIPFTAGVIGTNDQLTIYAARVAGVGKNVDNSGNGPNPPDARRVTYWLTDKGLARQELPWLTSQEVQTSTDPVMEDGKEEKDYVIAEEVSQLRFEYWDGTEWVDQWDGRTLNADGVTLLGPPMAIRVHFWLKLPGEDPGQTVEKEFRHTIAIRSAPGPMVPGTTTTPQQ
jgi:hypothetical protein